MDMDQPFQKPIPAPMRKAAEEIGSNLASSAARVAT